MPAALALVLVALAGGLNLVNPLLSGRIVDQVILGGRTELLWGILALMLGTVAVKTGLRYAFQMAFEHMSQSIIKALRKDLFALMQRMDFGFHDRTKTGDLMALMTGDIDAVRHFHAWVIYQVFENGLLLAASIGALFFIDPLLTLCLLGLTPFIALAAAKLARRVLPAFRAVRDQFSRLNSVAQENIGGARVVRAFAREAFEISKLEAESLAFRDRNMAVAAVMERYIPAIECFSGMLSAVLVLAGGALIVAGRLSMGELVTFTGLIWAVTMPLRMAGWLENDAQRFVASCKRLYEFSRQEPAISGPSCPVIPPSPIRGSLRFESVDFSYSGPQGRPALSGIDFSLEAGGMLGIVGPTGGGKSTIARLLCRFYDPCHGRILLDGIDLRELPLDILRTNIGVAMQDVFLFSDTIEGNIAFGKPDMPMARVLEASRLAMAHSFIEGLPQGYDTVVGERGVGLSGGQRQRVALARLLAMDPPVMILDDTMSAVDAETEAELQETLRTLHGSRTLVVIAHRISSVKQADLILFVQDGKVIERGRHVELLAAGGAYAAVCRHQAGMED
jgi:ATP-binding cassette subfamily B protein